MGPEGMSHLNSLRPWVPSTNCAFPVWSAGQIDCYMGDARCNERSETDMRTGTMVVVKYLGNFLWPLVKRKRNLWANVYFRWPHTFSSPTPTPPELGKKDVARCSSSLHLPRECITCGAACCCCDPVSLSFANNSVEQNKSCALRCWVLVYQCVFREKEFPAHLYRLEGNSCSWMHNCILCRPRCVGTFLLDGREYLPIHRALVDFCSLAYEHTASAGTWVTLVRPCRSSLETSRPHHKRYDPCLFDYSSWPIDLARTLMTKTVPLFFQWKYQ